MEFFMTSRAEDLRKLHQLLQELDRQKNELQSGPRRIKMQEQAVVKLEGQIATQKDALTQLQKAADQKNLSYKSLQQKLLDLQVKLNQAASNREYEILKGQLATEQEGSGKIEEEYLGLLEQIDAGKLKSQELQKQLEAAKATIVKTREAVTATEPGLKQAIAALTAQVRDAEACIPSSISDNYRRRSQVDGAAAMAVVEDDACSECQVELSPQHCVAVRAGTPIQCRECGRILYQLPK